MRAIIKYIFLNKRKFETMWTLEEKIKPPLPGNAPCKKKNIYPLVKDGLICLRGGEDSE